jgi:hypothetical protein
MRRTSRNQNKARMGWIMTAAAMMGVGTLFAAPMLIEGPAKLDQVTLCPVDRPLSTHVALLVDRTDPYNEAQQVRVAETIAKLKGKLPVGGKLTVHLLTADPSVAARPVIALCNPGDGSIVDPLVGNPRKVQRKFEEDFAAPINALTASLMEGAVADRSPIIEAISAVAGTLARDAPGKLIVISDFLENSGVQSHYRDAPDASAALSTVEGQVMQDGRLSGIAVDLVVLQSASQLQRQGEGLTAFWRKVLMASGAQPNIQNF